MKKDSSIELRHLRYFAAFCESGETSEAAKHLGVAPTTVKRCIRELERFLNVKLLVRGSRTLTDSGKLMHTHANNVLKYLTVADGRPAFRGRGATEGDRLDHFTQTLDI
jgi:DNA-binding transcriptional LysR family regulator